MNKGLKYFGPAKKQGGKRRANLKFLEKSVYTK